jgi:hypothetical protein
MLVATEASWGILGGLLSMTHGEQVRNMLEPSSPQGHHHFMRVVPVGPETWPAGRKTFPGRYILGFFTGLRNNTSHEQSRPFSLSSRVLRVVFLACFDGMVFLGYGLCSI